MKLNSECVEAIKCLVYQRTKGMYGLLSVHLNMTESMLCARVYADGRGIGQTLIGDGYIANSSSAYRLKKELAETFGHSVEVLYCG